MVTVLYDITPCSSVEAATTLQESVASVFYPEDGEGRIHPKDWYLTYENIRQNPPETLVSNV
jgi:hypothetical protein